MPQMEKQQREAQLKQQEQTQLSSRRRSRAATPAAPQAGAPAVPGAPAAAAQPAATKPRSGDRGRPAHRRSDTPRLSGSIDLKGARIDNLSLEQYRETVDPNSPPIVLFSPSGAPRSLLRRVRLGAGSRHDRKDARAGYGLDAGRQRRAAASIIRSRSSTTTATDLIFRRTIAVDDHYLFTLKDEVQNKGSAAGHAVSLCADLAPWHAARRRATTSCMKASSA